MRTKKLNMDTNSSIVTIGVFDGVHAGHRKVIKAAVSRASRLGLISIVVTFDPHPAKVLAPGRNLPMLMSLKHRMRLIKALGVDRIVVLPFTQAFARIRAEDFIRKVIANRLSAREVYVGEDFRFAKGGSTGLRGLVRIAAAHGILVRAVKHVKAAGRVVSSSLIRRLINSGDLGTASRLLGRNVSVLGTVVPGARLARELGYPTANINPHHEAIPPSGVYAIKAYYCGRTFNGILNIGVRPTFYAPNDREPAIEAHLFDFSKKIYGKDLEISFIRKIRREIAFKDKDKLVSRIRLDEKIARRILSK
jgi:riboflavin kinase/FMN adenylyltransferase